MMPVGSHLLARLGLGTALVLSVSACQTLSEDRGMSLARDIARAELGAQILRTDDPASAMAARERVEALLRKPLGPDDAVQIALLNNRGLQAAYHALGVSEAEFLRASLPPNPKIALSRLGGQLELEIERQLLVNVLALATLPARREIAADRFRAEQYRAAQATLALAVETRRQYYRAVAAQELVTTLERARLSAEAGSELAAKLGETGGLNKLEQAREHAFYAEISAELARARMRARIERERLTRSMGLWGNDIAYKLPGRLPALPAGIRPQRDIEREALTRRVDLQVARFELLALAKEYGLTEATRMVDDLELIGLSSYERLKEVHVDADGTPHVEKEKLNRRGLELEFEIPIFDFGQSKVARAEETYMRAANLLAQKAVDARSQAREAYQAYRGNHDVARLYQSRVLPLRRQIEEETLLQYNAMIEDVGQLVADARARILSQAQAIEARRDFFIARADMHAALVGGDMAGAAAGPSLAAAGGAPEGH